MQIKVAKSAGFCFGVKRAVGIAESYAEKGIPAVTLGEIIHNPIVVENLRRRGVVPIENIDECPPGATVILRSHGVPLSVIEKLEEKGIPYEDATCPFVARIHKIVAERTAAGDTVILTGNPDHAEVKGIIGHAKGDVRVVRNLSELEKLVDNDKNLCANCYTLLSQTTFLRAEWEKCEKFAKRVYTNLLIFDTICYDAYTKQREAAELSKECDKMLVIGGKNSYRFAFELLSSERFKELLKTLYNEYDYIIIDTPPTSLTADTESIADIVDVTLLVIRQDSTPVPQINDAADVLSSAQSFFAGCILNDYRDIYSSVFKGRMSESRTYGTSYYYG